MSKVRSFAAVFALAAMLCSSAAAQPPVTGIQWKTDLDAARAQAEKEGKLLLVHFWTTSCSPCVQLDSTVFNQPSVGKVIHDNYVPVKLNAGDFPATAEQFGVTRVPMEVVITPAGHVVEKFVSPATPMAYIGKLGQLAHGYQQEVHRQGQSALASVGAASQPLNSAYAKLVVPPGNPLVGSESAVPANGITENPYAAAVAARQSQTAQSAATSSTGLVQGAPQQDSQVSTTPITPIEPLTTANRYASETSTPTANTAVHDTYQTADTAAAPTNSVAKATLEAWAKELKLPPGSPELGFYGYCPVTMKQDFRWDRGNVQWGAIHRGRTYLFASEARRSEFLKDPDAFAPALSGIDPVLAIDQNKVAPGLRKYAVEYNGQFFLFSSEETLRAFWNKADSYSTEVRHAMNRSGSERIVR